VNGELIQLTDGTVVRVPQPSQEPMPQPSTFGGFPPNPVGLFILGFLLNAA
jgi:hypothetical protein